MCFSESFRRSWVLERVRQEQMSSRVLAERKTMTPQDPAGNFPGLIRNLARDPVRDSSWHLWSSRPSRTASWVEGDFASSHWQPGEEIPWSLSTLFYYTSDLFCVLKSHCLYCDLSCLCLFFFFNFMFLFDWLETGSLSSNPVWPLTTHYIAKEDLEILVLLPLIPVCWDHNHASSYLVYY